MSVMESLHHLEEADLTAWMERAAAATTPALLEGVRNDIIARARAHAGEEVQSWLQDHADASDDSRLPQDLGDLLMLLETKRTWHLGNLLGRGAQGLGQALETVPELRPLAGALRGEVRDLGRLRRIAGGLRVVLDRPAAAALVPLVQRWTGRADVTARVAEMRLPWLQRLLGRHAALRTWTTDDAVWERWQAMGEAITTVASSGGILVWETEV